MTENGPIPKPTKAGPPPSETRERAICGGLYDAALDGNRWDEALTALNDYVAVRESFVAVVDPRSMTYPLIATGQADPATREEYLRRWTSPEVNLWARAVATLPAGVATDLDRVVPRKLLERTDHYREFLVKCHSEQCLGCVLARTPDSLMIYSGYRSARDPTFGEHDEAGLQRFVPHLQRALEVYRRLAVVESAGRQVLEALHHLELGVVLLDGKGRVLFANRSATRIFVAADGLTALGGELRAQASGDERALLRLIAAVTRTGQRQGGGAGGALLVERSSGKRPLSVLVAPLRDNPFQLGTRVPVAVVFLSDPERGQQRPSKALACLYRLTPKETAVAELVGNGSTLRDVAAALGVSLSTARTHLYRVFDKVGVRRQAELVKLLLTNPGRLGHE